MGKNIRKTHFRAGTIVGSDYYVWKTPNEQPLTKGLITINSKHQ